MVGEPVLALVIGLLVGALCGMAWGLRRLRQVETMSQRALRAASHEVAAERARRLSLDHRLQAVERLVAEALVYVDEDGTVIGASPAAARWFQLGSLDLAGQHPVSAMRALRSTELASLVSQASGGPIGPTRVRFGDQLLSARAVPLDGGGVIMAVRDITEVERLARARRDLVSNVSHDLRTPLTSIGLMVEGLATHALDDPVLSRTLVVRIGEQLATLNSLVQAMLDLDRIESGHAIFRLAPVHLRSVTREAVAAVAPQTEQRNVAISVDVLDALRVLADGPYLRRALTNLLDNAVRFSPVGAQVQIVSGEHREDMNEGFVTLEVLDEGPGIPPADLQRVFERFYRSERSRAGAGSGLGLAITRHIIEGHGGRVEAMNRPGRGAAFRVTLPIAEAPVETPASWAGEPDQPAVPSGSQLSSSGSS